MSCFFVLKLCWYYLLVSKNFILGSLRDFLFDMGRFYYQQVLFQ